MGELRVIFVNRVYWPSTSATAQLLTDLAEGLAARGWDVHVVTTGENSTRHQGVTIHRTGTPEKHGGLVSRALNHRAFLRGARRQLDALLRPGDVVVAMTDPPLLGAMVAEAASARGARVVQWIQDIYPEIAEIHFGALARVFLGRFKSRRDDAWQRAAACVTLGEDMVGFVASHGIARNRIRLLPNWATRELQELPSAADIAAVRQEWQAEGVFVAVYSGNLGRVHEFDTILEAAALLREQPQLRFLFIGQGARFDEVAATARQRGLANVHLRPAVPRTALAASLAAADAHLVSLRPEYRGLVHPSKLAGALAAGVPALFIGSEGDIARLLRERQCGAAIARGDAAALAATLRQWAVDPAGHARLRARAREAYAENFAFATALANWDRLLRDVHAKA